MTVKEGDNDQTRGLRYVGYTIDLPNHAPIIQKMADAKLYASMVASRFGRTSSPSAWLDIPLSTCVIEGGVRSTWTYVNCEIWAFRIQGMLVCPSHVDVPQGDWSCIYSSILVAHGPVHDCICRSRHSWCSLVPWLGGFYVQNN
jgi:hypothetical protein